MGKDNKYTNNEAQVSDYSTEQVEDYLTELEDLLDSIESAKTHYEVLGVDALATTGEIKLAYTRASALLNPSYYNLDLPQPETLLPRIDVAFEKVAAAFSLLVSFNRRAEYDDSLFERAEVSEPKPVTKASENRRHQRFELALPVRVSGYDQGGGKWHEMTQSVDVSVSGVLLRLGMPVRKGVILNLSMPMPMTLRSHGFFESTYDVYAIVRRIEYYDEKSSLIGIEFLGEQPPDSYFGKPWATFDTGALELAERRQTPRKKRIKPIYLEYFDVDNNLIHREDGITEDISSDGLRVCVKFAPENFYLVKVSTNTGSLANLARIVDRFIGEDGIERLCLNFVKPVS